MHVCLLIFFGGGREGHGWFFLGGGEKAGLERWEKGVNAELGSVFG